MRRFLPSTAFLLLLTTSFYPLKMVANKVAAHKCTSSGMLLLLNEEMTRRRTNKYHYYTIITIFITIIIIQYNNIYTITIIINTIIDPVAVSAKPLLTAI